MNKVLDSIKYLLIVLLFTAAFLETLIFRFGSLGWTTTEIVIGAYILFTGFEFVIGRKKPHASDRLFWAFVALLLVGTVSSLRAPYPDSAMRLWIRFAVAALVYLGLRSDLTDERAKKVALWAIGISFTLFAISGIVEHFRCDLVDPWARHFRAKPLLGESRGAICGSSVAMGLWPDIVVRSSSVIVHPNVLGYLLAFCLFLVWSYKSWKKPALIIKLVFLAFAEMAIFYTYSRGAMVALAAGLVSFILLFTYHGTQRFVGMSVIAATIVSCLLAFGISRIDLTLGYAFKRSVVLVAPDSLLEQAKMERSERGIYEASARAIGTRLTLWSVALQMFRQKPLLGWGLSQFKMLYSTYISKWTWDLIRGRGSFYAHNLFLNVMAELGILGLLALLWMVKILIESAWKFCLQDKPEKWVLVGALCVFLVANTFDVIFISSYASLLVFCLMSALIVVESKAT